MKNYSYTFYESGVKSDDETLQRAVAANIDYVLTKPVLDTELETRIDYLLKVREFVSKQLPPPITPNSKIQTYLKIPDRWYWIGLQIDIARKVSRCKKCLQSISITSNCLRIDRRSIEVDHPGQYFAMYLLRGLPMSWVGESYVKDISVLSTIFAKFLPLSVLC